jgi:prepilin-type N-terminal cleavage/methylation domain-containing protein
MPRQTPTYRALNRAFTLIELVVVMAILSILSALTLAGLSGAATKSKQETTEFMINRLNDAIMDWYEDYEDLAKPGPGELVALRSRIREEMPDSWGEVFASSAAASTAAGRAYSAYRQVGASHANFTKYQSAECLFMIITRSGRFPDFLEDIRPERVGDIDGDGLKEFWDGWNRPIAFFRWAPGFASFIQPIDVASGDPLDQSDPPADSTAYPLFPIIYSPGPDEATNDPLSGPDGYGLITAANGWPNSALPSICTFDPDGNGLVGAPKPGDAYLDNITNHDLMAR